MLPFPWILCNHLQNAVATTYIFGLQLSTFLFYNKHVKAIPHKLTELPVLLNNVYLSPKGTHIPNSFPLHEVIISEQTRIKMGISVPYAFTEPDISTLYHKYFNEILVNFFFDYLQDDESFMLKVYDSLLCELEFTYHPERYKPALERVAALLGKPVPEILSPESPLNFRDKLNLMLQTAENAIAECESKQSENESTPDDSSESSNVNIEQSPDQLCQSLALFEEVPSQDFFEHSSFQNTLCSNAHLEFYKTKCTSLISDIAFSEGLSLTRENTKEILEVLPSTELSDEELKHAIRTALQPQIEKARAFFAEE